MDYIQYNNAARDIARAAAFSQKTTFDDTDKENFTSNLNPLTSLYTAKISEITKDTDNSTVTVKIELTRATDLQLLKLLSDDDSLEFPPKKLKDIVYTMPIEKAALESE